ncbi:ribosomal protein L13 [Alkalidesulfovibrio alkalitolerans DSM 16529]|uniref:Large ribosomal subunit protein uL13 n=1 Tax=Alkalidesulfovibrio alkalitolerans DSM 16529 TaxID=1121439 RepID=S7UGK4_9BACT|nr:50S ribosomal protein L13 [Alkalidesulfovibrio alkalitolerans]EPR32964.1 ribosomal protein L13 [Alkalidesulfovibrio alkalitolerans DSM 16529]
MKTWTPTLQEIKRDWIVVDAQDKILGRLATQIAMHLRGKHKPEYTPHMDNGDFVVVVNAEKIAVTGNKLQDKKYYRHSGFPGGIKEISLRDQLNKKPEEVIRLAVRGMLPKNRLGRQLLKKLKIYAGPEHPHTAQEPKPLDI